jgi:hypothetical protein
MSRSLLGDHLSIAVGRCRRMLRVRRRTALLATNSHAGVVSEGLAADEGGRALRQRWARGRTQRRSCESVKGCHGGRAVVLLCVRSQGSRCSSRRIAVVSIGLRLLVSVVGKSRFGPDDFELPISSPSPCDGGSKITHSIHTHTQQTWSLLSSPRRYAAPLEFL